MAWGTYGTSGGSSRPTAPSGVGATGGATGVDTSGIIGGVLQGIGTITDAALDYDAQQKQLEFEKSQLRYQKQLQNILMSREDSAMQRRVIDLQAAGLSPVLAAGGSGASAGPVVSTVTPTAPKFQTGLSSTVNNVLSILKQKADISATTAQQEFLEAQRKKAIADTNLTNVKTYQAGMDATLQAKSGTTSSGTLANTLQNAQGMILNKLSIKDPNFEEWSKKQEQEYQEYLKTQK